MEMSESINELATALAKAQGQMTGALKDAANPFFKSKYADLASVWEACRKPLSDHGLSILQSPSTERGDNGVRVSVETLLLHASGQWIKGTVSVSAKEDSPQAVGSCISYLKRYALQSFAGVAPEDDDGEAAQGRNKSVPMAVPPPPAPPPGYDAWLLQLQASVKDGYPILEAAWTASPREFREYLHLTDRGRIEGMKAAAKAATATMEALNKKAALKSVPRQQVMG